MIMKDLLDLDDLLIDRLCQPAVDWISQMREISCFGIARICIDISTVAWILSEADDAIAATKAGPLGMKMFQYALILVMLGALVTLRSVFERAGGTGSRGRAAQANPLRVSMATHRLILLVGLIGLLVQTVAGPVDFATVTRLAMSFFVTTGLYMGACMNRPPKRREYAAGNWQQAAAPTA
jgi:hypothetical protein